MKNKIIATIMLSAISAFAGPNFDTNKANVLQNLDRESMVVSEAKACVEKAADPKALKACMQTFKDTNKQIWAKPKKADGNVTK
jgi:hypothetical protein